MAIRSITILGAGLALACAGGPAMAAGEGGAAAAAALPMMGKSYAGARSPVNHVRPGGAVTVHRWGARPNGRWHAGWNAPGGWKGYRRPVYGYVLPRYWISPSYHIGNYRAYGLPAPAYGYGWSRYYDDAVMTDRYGRVYDYRSDVDWGRYEGGYDDYYDDRYDGRGSYREDSGLGGAAIGAVVGGIAGNRIAGRGNRTTGTLIGAGVGAVAGYAIDKAEDDRPRHAPPRRSRDHGVGYDYGYGYADDMVTTNNDYQGRWVGTWYGRDGSTYSGEYEGGYQGTVRGSYGVDYDAPPVGGRPHWDDVPVRAPMAPPAGHGGYVAGGYYYPAPTVTTVVVQPAMTTTTTYVTEHVTYRKPVARKAVARKKVCPCK